MIDKCIKRFFVSKLYFTCFLFITQSCQVVGMNFEVVLDNTYMIGHCFASKKFEGGKQLNAECKDKVSLKTSKEANEPFAIVRAQSAFELCRENLVPIYEKYDERTMVGEEKTFQMLPRRFATKLLKIEGAAMFPEDNFTEAENEALNSFVEKKYLKSARVAGKTVFYDLNSNIRKYLISVLKQRN
jgi:hypothetical protein